MIKPLANCQSSGESSFLCSKSSQRLSLTNKELTMMRMTSKLRGSRTVLTLDMVPMGESPFLCFIDIFRHNSSELPLRYKTHNLSEDILSCMYLSIGFDSVAKMQTSEVNRQSLI